MIELVRGKIRRNCLEEGKRVLDIDVSHMLEVPIKEDTVVWQLNIPFNCDGLEVGEEVTLNLGTQPGPLTINDTFPAFAIDTAIKQIQTTKPNDRSDQDRWYQIILTDLQKCLANAVTYLK